MSSWGSVWECLDVSEGLCFCSKLEKNSPDCGEVSLDETLETSLVQFKALVGEELRRVEC
jgi:hypothetical protein